MTTETTGAAPAPAKPIRLPPIVTMESKEFWEAADKEQFIGQKCGDCGKFRFPPQPMCAHCHSLKREDVLLSGYGTVHSWCRPMHPPPFGFREPPIVAVIQLQEGTRFVSNVIGVKIEDIKQDMEVEVCWEDTMNKHKVPVFRPRSK